MKRLAEAFRAAGRPVVYLAHVLKPDYSDAAFPYWRVGYRAWERQPHALLLWRGRGEHMRGYHYAIRALSGHTIGAACCAVRNKPTLLLVTGDW